MDFFLIIPFFLIALVLLSSADFFPFRKKKNKKQFTTNNEIITTGFFIQNLPKILFIALIVTTKLGIDFKAKLTDRSVFLSEQKIFIKAFERDEEILETKSIYEIKKYMGVNKTTAILLQKNAKKSKIKRYITYFFATTTAILITGLIFYYAKSRTNIRTN